MAKRSSRRVSRQGKANRAPAARRDRVSPPRAAVEGERKIEEEVRQLRADVAVLGEMAEKNVTSAVMALVDCNSTLAQEVIAYDAHVNEMQVQVDARCVELLRRDLYSETARFVFACLKISSELKRVSALACDIAKQVLLLAQKCSILEEGVADLSEMLESAEQMIRDAVQSLVACDPRLASDVWGRIEPVRRQGEHLTESLVALMSREPGKADRAVRVLLVVLDLGRIADQATSIAEEVIYMTEGRMVKHREHTRIFGQPLHGEEKEKAVAQTARFLRH